MRARLAGLSILCKRFAAVLRRCDSESFLTIGRIYPEIAPMEKRIDMHVDLLRRDEFREEECVSDVIKYVPETSISCDVLNLFCERLQDASPI
jgi:dynactin 1